MHQSIIATLRLVVMAFLITVFLSSMIIISRSAKLGSSQLAIPPPIVNDNSCTPVRTCGRPTSAGGSCPGVQYSVKSLQYSKVCGRVIGYQDGSSDTFFPGHSLTSPDDIYVDRVSLTHGMPCKHIWTFAVGGTDGSLLSVALALILL